MMIKLKCVAISKDSLVKFIKFIIFILFTFAVFLNNGSFANENYKVKDLIVDNSDRMILILGEGNFKKNKTSQYLPSTSSINLINNITTMTLNSPPRYVIDIPNAILIGTTRDIKVENSSVIQSIKLSQFSPNPAVVRMTVTLKNSSDLKKFQTYTNGADILIKYTPQLVNNTKLYKFYTPSGDMDKTIAPQNVSVITTFSNSDEVINFVPKFQTKYYLSAVSQNPHGLLLKGLGAISYQKINYFNDRAEIILDNSTLSKNLENKIYNIPIRDSKEMATLQVAQFNNKKIKLSLYAQNPKDFRFVVSPDTQSLFVAHRQSVLNTVFSSDSASIVSYSSTLTSANYKIFDLVFDKKISYEIFELNDNLYLDILNLPDFNEAKFNMLLKDEAIEAAKIASDKTRYTIPLKNLNFSYASIESNAKSIKICFKQTSSSFKEELPGEIVLPPQKEEIVLKDETTNLNVTYIPKDEDKKIKKSKKSKEKMEIKTLHKVVLDPGHG